MRAPIAVGLRKSKGVPCHRRQLAGGYQLAVDRRVAIRVDHQLVAENVGAGPGEVEVTVLRQIDVRRLIGGRGVVDNQLVVVGEAVDHSHLQVAGIAFFAVGADPREAERILAQDLRLPQVLVEPSRAAVKVVGAVVRRQGVRLLVDREAPLRDAIAVSADDRPEERMAFQVPVDRVEAEHDVADGAVSVRHLQRRDDAAIGDRRHLDAVGVLQGEGLHRLAVGGLAKGSARDGRHRSRRSRAIGGWRLRSTAYRE